MLRPSGVEVDFLARYPEGHREVTQVCADLHEPTTQARDPRLGRRSPRISGRVACFGVQYSRGTRAHTLPSRRAWGLNPIWD